jgi:hypothetical protein
MTATVSLLGEEIMVLEGCPSSFKAILLAPWRVLDAASYPGAVRIVANRLDPGTASALGFRRSRFAEDLLGEIWFDSAASRARALSNEDCVQGGQGALMPVREVLIFGPDKPWRA